MCVNAYVRLGPRDQTVAARSSVTTRQPARRSGMPTVGSSRMIVEAIIGRQQDSNSVNKRWSNKGAIKW